MSPAWLQAVPGPFDGMSPQEMRDMLETINALRAKQIEQSSVYRLKVPRMRIESDQALSGKVLVS
jgi:hypothetical protein